MDNTIKKYFTQICEKFNLASSFDDASIKGLNAYLYIDYSSSYGGYRFNMINIKSGGQYGAFGKSSACERMQKKVFLAYCEGLLQI